MHERKPVLYQYAKGKKPASFEITLILNNDVISVYSMLSNCYNVTPTKMV